MCDTPARLVSLVCKYDAFAEDLNAVLERPVPVFQAVGRHQAVERDLAIVVKETVTHAAVVEAIRAPASPWLRDVVLFDVYRPKPGAALDADSGAVHAQKSMAVRLTLNSDEATLNEAQIEGVVQAVLAELAAQVSARLRA